MQQLAVLVVGKSLLIPFAILYGSLLLALAILILITVWNNKKKK